VPLLFFYIPYYFFGVFAFFTHIACIHRLKAKALGWKNTDRQAQIIMGIGAIIGLLILAGLTDNFQFMEIPLEYREIYE
jgi:dihydrofolate reductase